MFCHSSLGHNEALEHFSVGRRIAYDPAKGRLWAVCRRCERWNLSPLETRWEAVEEAERAFRGTPLHVSTDNIGLARLREGLELVRIGASPRIELAGWRYGDQFGRRRRNHVALATTAAIGMLVPGITPYVGLWAFGAVATVATTGFDMWNHHRDNQLVRAIVRDVDNGALELTHQNMLGAALIPVPDRQDWTLLVPYFDRRGTTGSPDPTSHPFMRPGAVGEAVLTGDAARRALTSMLPHLNRSGGAGRRVREAVDVLSNSPNLEHLIYAASINTEAKRTHLHIKDGESNVGALPARLRLALEMVLHEDDERRALDGELRELEERWREAETVARIADGLLLPADVEERVARMKQR